MAPPRSLLASLSLGLLVGMVGVSLSTPVSAAVPKDRFAFLEEFQVASLEELFSEGAWVKSDQRRYAEQEWVLESSYEGKDSGIEGDKSLIVNRPHKHYGISRLLLPQALDNTDKDLVIQYEVRLHAGIGCSGAYLKLLTAPFENQKALAESTGYTVMFGPDRCGATNKVHLIFRVQNPLSKEWEEKHMSKLIPAPTDGVSHLYTMELKSDGSFRVLIDLEEKVSGSLADDHSFKPSFKIPQEIDDPNDFKPADWVDQEKIPDPEARKPEDWDDDAPKTIPDPDAKKPEAWLDDEPLLIPNPDAVQPSDWVEEEDGAWEAPLIKNPKCEAAGCGKWSPPIIENPKYRGKWSPAMIPNPMYIGQWKPRRIPNPYFYENSKPANLAPIGAVAIEILANEKGIGFDNIIVGTDIEAAQQFAKETFSVKQTVQKAAEYKIAKEKAAEEREKLRKDGGFGHVLYYFALISEIVLENMIAVGVTVGLLVISLTWYCCISGSGPFQNEAPSQKASSKVKDSEEDEEDDGEGEGENEEGDDNEEEEEEKKGAAKPEAEDDEDDDGKGAIPSASKSS